jgi:hypothetical protein
MGVACYLVGTVACYVVDTGVACNALTITDS